MILVKLKEGKVVRQLQKNRDVLEIVVRMRNVWHVMLEKQKFLQLKSVELQRNRLFPPLNFHRNIKWKYVPFAMHHIRMPLIFKFMTRKES